MIELPIPATISSEEKARELIRMWHSEDGELTVTIDGWLDSPTVCGRLIVDLAVLVAKDYVATNAWRGTLEAALYRIISAADVEIQNPTNSPVLE